MDRLRPTTRADIQHTKIIMNAYVFQAHIDFLMSHRTACLSNRFPIPLIQIWRNKKQLMRSG